MEVLSGRILLRPTDGERCRRFYRDVIGFAIYREFGPPDEPGLVFFLGHGFLELFGRSAEPAGPGIAIWLPVRDVAAGYDRLPPVSPSRASPGVVGPDPDVDRGPGRCPHRPRTGARRSSAASRSTMKATLTRWLWVGWSSWDPCSRCCGRCNAS
jgi:catechol 2,3-dioxygenase-like lactoylglutathione lyase family enzyme